MRILAVDHGTKNIGVAISDPTGTIANPLTVFKHVSRLLDAQVIAGLAIQHEAVLILIGQSLDEEGGLTLAGRRAARFASVLRRQIDIPVVLWDEAFTTQEARTALITLRISRKRRSGHLDDLAATLLLQSYLDTRSEDQDSQE